MAVLVGLGLLAAACGIVGDEEDPLADLRPVQAVDGPTTTVASEAPVDVLEVQVEEPFDRGGADVAVDLRGDGAPFDRRLLGSNLPAWVGPTRDNNPWYYESIEASGVELIRFPGGSWSNHYAWLACLENDEECDWLWANTVEDFIRIMSRVEADFIWTARFNGTPEEAAALVAFFNASVDDTTEIGVDRNGDDWRTVGDWARLRTELGYPDPVRVQYWEIGNEIYGAVADAGPDCAEFGWERVSTCDGEEYVVGTADQPGYLEFAAAMKAVDPEIEIGAVGVTPVDAWGNFGNEVLAFGRDEIDFYVVHYYGFGGRPNADDVIGRAADHWPATTRRLRESIGSWGLGDLPVAVTEYNLVAFQDNDGDALMRRAINTFFLVENMGEMALGGVDMAAQWNLFGGDVWNRTNYGLIHMETGRLMPQFFAMRMWSMMGDTLRAVDAVDGLQAYATTTADGGVQLLVLNPTGEVLPLDIALAGGDDGYELTMDIVSADELLAETVRYNDAPAESAGALAEPISLGRVGADFSFKFDPTSITLLRLTPA